MREQANYYRKLAELNKPRVNYLLQNREALQDF